MGDKNICHAKGLNNSAEVTGIAPKAALPSEDTMMSLRTGFQLVFTRPAEIDAEKGDAWGFLPRKRLCLACSLGMKVQGELILSSSRKSLGFVEAS
jgi:hypothetical protein